MSLLPQGQAAIQRQQASTNSVSNYDSLLSSPYKIRSQTDDWVVFNEPEEEILSEEEQLLEEISLDRSQIATNDRIEEWRHDQVCILLGELLPDTSTPHAQQIIDSWGVDPAEIQRRQVQPPKAYGDVLQYNEQQLAAIRLVANDLSQYLHGYIDAEHAHARAEGRQIPSRPRHSPRDGRTMNNPLLERCLPEFLRNLMHDNFWENGSLASVSVSSSITGY